MRLAIRLSVLLAVAVAACDTGPPLQPEAGPDAALEAGATSTQASGPVSVTIDSSEPFEKVSGYTYVEATMHGEGEGEYAVPIVLIYPNDGGNGVGVVDWANTATHDFEPPLDEEATAQLTRVTTDGHLFENEYTYASVQWHKAVTETFGDEPPEDDHHHLNYGFIEEAPDGFQILRDAAGLLRDPVAHDGPDGLLPVEAVVSSGFSQTATLQMEFLTQGENLVDGELVYDGHLVGAGGFGCNMWVDEFPYSVPRPLCEGPVQDAPDGSRVMVIATQSDVEAMFLAALSRIDDLEHPEWRQYELAGVSHLPQPVFPEVGDESQNPADFRSVFRAGFHNMAAWTTDGTPPPPSRFIEGVLQADGTLATELDADGNAVGGLRLPHMTKVVNGREAGAPLGSYTGLNLAGAPPTTVERILLFLSGTFTPFDDDELQERYPNPGAYVNRVARAAENLLEQGYILEEDKDAYVRDAAQSSIGQPATGRGGGKH